ncbi:putative transposable element [Trichonephila clavipes]|nr:putative transposable element [Trichonephila clavipes]
MITNFFIPELNNHDVQELWFQQDGATCHTDRATIDLLKDTFGDRLISRFRPVNRPPRSCDLTPLDYFLWGYVKSLVYMRISHKRLTIWKTTFAVLFPIYGHKYWKKSSKIGRPDWTTSKPAMTALLKLSALKRINKKFKETEQQTLHPGRGRKAVSNQVKTDITIVIADGLRGTIVGTDITDSVEYSLCL